MICWREWCDRVFEGASFGPLFSSRSGTKVPSILNIELRTYVVAILQLEASSMDKISECRAIILRLHSLQHDSLLRYDVYYIMCQMWCLPDCHNGTVSIIHGILAVEITRFTLALFTFYVIHSNLSFNRSLHWKLWDGPGSVKTITQSIRWYFCKDRHFLYHQTNAVFNYPVYGPTFGDGHDLAVWSNGSKRLTHHTDTTGFGNATFTGRKMFDVKDWSVRHLY